VLEQESLDLAIGPAMALPRGARRAHWATTKFLCGLRRGHPALRRSLTLARYCELSHILISPTGQGASIVDDALERRGVSRQVSLRVESFLLAPAIVAESDLVLTAPAMVFAGALSSRRIVTSEPPLKLPDLHLHLYWSAKREGGGMLDWLRSELMTLSAS
jgi:DNA-binding transcriptional LysR family regulator